MKAKAAPMRKTDDERNRKRAEKAMDCERREIEALKARIEAGAPRPGSNPIAETLPETPVEDPVTKCVPYVGAKRFDQLPLSEKTLGALSDANYVNMTEIQRAAIPHALNDRDVLGAAKTGSGKTLAFLVPMVEMLYREKWGSMDGVGAVIISPTRELAVQIFEELKKVTKYHSFTLGFLIGGKNLDAEKQVVTACNIIVCTTGRLLYHLGSTVNFHCSNLKVLVLDEADRLLDMGFKKDLDNILSQLPTEDRRTYLFSATQTKSVQDLARLSLKDPEYLAVHAESSMATPERLQQAAVIVPLEKKLDMLWCFLKTRLLKGKSLVFLSTCKMVRFVYEVFRHGRPGVQLTCLHGRQSQEKRLAIFHTFVHARNCVLIATDIAARGLDFPAVNWVVQADCPDDVATYIHRVGRTARYTSSGQSLLFLLPSEEKMVGLLKDAKIPIKLRKTNERTEEKHTISGRTTSLLSQDSDLRRLAERAFITYVRSINIQSNKEVFDVDKLPIAEFAASLGLPTAPQVRKIGSSNKKKNEPYDLEKEVREAEMEENKDPDLEEDLFKKKRPRDAEEPELHETGATRPRKKKLKIDPAKTSSQRLVFDDDEDEEVEDTVPSTQRVEERASDHKEEARGAGEEDMAALAGARYKMLKKEMRERDKEDKLLERTRLRNKRLQNQEKSKEFLEEENEDDEDQEDGANGNSSAEEDPVEEVQMDEDEGDEDDEMEEEEEEKGGSKSRLGKLSLAQQEALARRLLNSKG